jgi:hypothetical protein
VIGHELTHIQLEFESAVAGKAQWFCQTARTRKYVSSLYRERKALLRCLGVLDPAEIDRAVAADATNLLGVVINRPMDIAVESWIHRNVPCLSAAQLLSFYYIQETGPSPALALAQPSLLRPQWLDIVSLALNGMQAMVQDSFHRGATAFAEPYRNTEVFPLASQLWQHWLSVCPSLGPGDEYDLVNAFGKIVGLSQAYECQTYSRQGPPAKSSEPSTTT